jgi:hypothetical protein
MKAFIFFLYLLMISSISLFAWGFFGHKKINEIAVYTLPGEIFPFYKNHINQIVEDAVLPDKRRYINPKEAARHYIDIDHYGDSAIYTMPENWNDAKEKYSEDTLLAYGIVPWHLIFLKYQLTSAFSNHDLKNILRLSSDIGHYIGDANVPLHTTENYNGQLTGQKGIHGLWESRIPELFFDDYDLFTGKAIYLENPKSTIWKHVREAHLKLDSVLRFEKELSARFPEDLKYSYEKRGRVTIKGYSKKYSEEYHKMLNGMVERQMKRSIILLGSFWYTCWIDAGQPDPKLFKEFSQTELDSIRHDEKFETRQHE